MIFFLRGLVDYSKSNMKAVILLHLNVFLKTHLIALLLGSLRISFIEGQKHLKSLLLLHDLFFMCEGHAMFKSFTENHCIRPHICMEEEEMEVDVLSSV